MRSATSREPALQKRLSQQYPLQSDQRLHSPGDSPSSSETVNLSYSRAATSHIPIPARSWIECPDNFGVGKVSTSWTNSPLTYIISLDILGRVRGKGEGFPMETTATSKGQIVIPSSVRRK